MTRLKMTSGELLPAGDNAVSHLTQSELPTGRPTSAPCLHALPLWQMVVLADSAEAFVDWRWNCGTGFGRARHWTDGRGAVPGAILTPIAVVWPDRIVSGGELSSRTSFSFSLSRADDPHSHHRFQSDHFPAAAADFASLSWAPAVGRGSGAATGPRPHPAAHGARRR